jgi:hypothetical protein
MFSHLKATEILETPTIFSYCIRPIHPKLMRFSEFERTYENEKYTTHGLYVLS